MKKTANYYFIFDRRKRARRGPSNGKIQPNGSIELVIYTPEGKRSFQTTGVRIEPRFWDETTRSISRKHPDHVYLNAVLEKIISEYREKEAALMASGKPLSLQEIKKAAEPKEGFCTWARKQLLKDSMKDISARSHRRSLDLLEEFAGDIPIHLLNYEVIYNWNAFLNKGSYSMGTIWRFNKDIKKFVHLAIRFGLIQDKDNPYRLIKIKRGAARETFLSLDELKRIRDLDLEPFSDYDRARDFFLFSCYTGLRYSDIRTLSLADFEKKADGYTLTLTRMKKVDKRVHLKLYELFDGAAQSIIEKYQQIPNERPYNEKYLVGIFLSNPEINLYLKQFAELAGIKKKLTFHVGRHTFGTLYAYKTKSIFEVMRAMGISSFATAKVYISLSDEI